MSWRCDGLFTACVKLGSTVGEQVVVISEVEFGPSSSSLAYG